MNEGWKILDNINTENKFRNTYIVPADYFQNLSLNILLKIKSQSQVYIVQDGYFKNLHKEILHKINIISFSVKDELEQIAPILNAINKQHIYTLPDGYFGNNAIQKPQTKVAGLKFVKWFKYASAAAVITIAGILFLNKNNSDNKEIAQMHSQAIQTNVATAVQKVSDEDLAKNLNDDKILVTQNETDESANAIPFVENVEQEVQLLADDEIENYINNNKEEMISVHS